MSNVKVSELPVYSGSPSGTWFVIDDSTLTTTSRIQLEDFNNGSSGTSGTSGYNGANGTSGTSGTSGNSGASGSSGSSGTSGINGTSGTSGINGTSGTSGSSGSSGSSGIVNLSNPALGRFTFSNATGDAITGSANLVVSGSVVVVSGSFLTTGSGRFTNTLSITGNTTTTNGVNRTTFSDRTIDLYPQYGYLELYNSGYTVTVGMSLSSSIDTFTQGWNKGPIIYSGPTNQAMIGFTSDATNISLLKNTDISGSLKVTGSVIITGSVNGNVVPLTVTSNTASLDLSRGTFFTLQLTSGSCTHLLASNIRPGYTGQILVNTTGSGTICFDSSFKQSVTSSYVPSTFTTQDLLSLSTFNSSSIYVTSVKNLG